MTEEISPEKLDETAASMAWTLNDELWETATESRREIWRGFARESIRALMLPQAEKKIALNRLHDRIRLEGLTP